MQKFRVRYLTVLSLLSLTSVFILFDVYSSQNRPTANINAFPLVLGDWYGEDIFIEKRIFDILETDAILMRKYINKNGDIVLFYIVYYPTNKVSFHAPEACFGGEGYTIMDKRIEAMKIPNTDWSTLKVNRLYYQRGDDKQIIVYFFESGDFMTYSHAKLRWKMLQDQIKFKRATAALVRLSTPLTGSNKDEAEDVLRNFLAEILPILPEYL